MENKTVLEMRNIHKSFPGVRALQGVDFTLPFSKALKQQTITGTLSERLPDAKYRSVAAGIAKAVI